MTALHKAAQQALWAFELHVQMTWPMDRSTAAIAALRAALAQGQAEPPTNQCGETCERAKLCAASCQGVESMEAKQTPLIELLERVPQDARVVVEHDQFSSSSHPVGRLCHEAAAALRAALTQKQAEPDTCTWHQDGDSDSGVYATSCGHYFRIEDGTPEDNKMQWCCYCGKKLAQELITEDDDE